MGIYTLLPIPPETEFRGFSSPELGGQWGKISPLLIPVTLYRVTNYLLTSSWLL